MSGNGSGATNGNGPADKRFKSFLWSQTRKAAYAETRLSLDGNPEPATAKRGTQPLNDAPAAEPASPTFPGRSKGRLTPLEQATMRMSEFCAPPTDASVPSKAPGAVPQVQNDEAPSHESDWHQLHVLPQGQIPGPTTPFGRLNVRQAP